MIRPIDADALKECFPDNGEGSWTYNVTAKAYIDAQPTVDAIPIDYMRSQVDSGKWEEIITRWKEHEKTD